MKSIFLSLILIFLSQYLFAEENYGSDTVSGFVPIIQVFGNAEYSFDNNSYNYYLGRTHIGAKYVFNQNWSAKVIIDRGRPTSLNDFVFTDTTGSWSVEPDVNDGAYYTMWLKFASIKWNITPKLSLETGALLQNHYITQERFWGHRFVAQTFQDRYWKIPSSDLGFLARYKINETISLDAAITNGEGLRVKQDDTGKIKFAGGIDVNLADWIQLRAYSHFRQSPINNSDESMLSLFAGFTPCDRFRIGGEINFMHNLNFVSDVNSYGFSAFAILDFADYFDVYFRVDQLSYNLPEASLSELLGGNAIISGVSYSPVESVRFSLNYQNWIQVSKNVSANVVGFSFEFKI